MRFNVISNLSNGVGLQQDFTRLKLELEARGHQVQGVQFNAKPLLIRPADVNIFDEVVTPLAFKAAPIQWVMPHPEWWFSAWDRYPFDMVLAKTHDCERLFCAKVGDRCQYLGWAARDLYDPTIPRQRKFLHVAGKSQMKNTPAVILGCQQAGVPLTVIGEHTGRLIRRVSDQDLKGLMNSHFCQVMPSAYEGYGHVLHEAMGTGQVIITTDAPPMNEIEMAFVVPSVGQTRHHAAPLHQVSPLDIARVIKQVLALTDENLTGYRDLIRAQYQRDVQAFQLTLDRLVGRR